MDRYKKFQLKHKDRLADERKQKYAQSKIERENAIKSGVKKKCIKCEEDKPVKEFYATIKGEYGVGNVCAQCTLERRNKWRNKRSEKIEIDLSAEKKCSTCGEIKVGKQFNKDKTSSDGLSYLCKKCATEKSKKHWHENIDENRKKGRDYYKKNRKKLLDYQEKYRKENSKKIKDFFRKNYNENKEKKIEYTKKYSSQYIKYNDFSDLLTVDEDSKPNSDGILTVKCTYCGRRFKPTYSQVKKRYYSLIGKGSGECRLYCSSGCKESCPVYGRYKHPEGSRSKTREANPVLRQIVLERDGFECQKCFKTVEEAPLHVHHIKPFSQDKTLSEDPDNCITLCKSCHKKVHSKKGCGYHELRCG